MPRGTYLSEAEKGKILAYRECDVGIREIARRLNRSHNVICHFLKNPDGYGNNKKGGPKKKLSARSQRRIINAASNSLKSLNQIKADLMLDVSRSTIYRTLKGSACIKRQKLKQAPRLLARHKEARLRFARENIRRDWSKVCW
jgi:IS30 family transposase